MKNMLFFFILLCASHAYIAEADQLKPSQSALPPQPSQSAMPPRPSASSLPPSNTGQLRVHYSNSVSRTPTMSKAQTFSPNSAPLATFKPGSLPHPSPLPSPSKLLPRSGSLPGGHEAQANSLQQFLKNRNPGQPLNLRAAREGLSSGLNKHGANSPSAVTSNLHQRLKQRNNAAMRYRHDIAHEHPNRRTWFNQQFWNNHHFHPNYWHKNMNWGRYNNWGSLNGWLAWGYGAPIYYEEGYPIDISGDEDEFYSQQQNSIYNAETSEPALPNWLPLGVFAIANDEESEATPVMFFQLALSKDGALAGSYYNQSTDQLYPINGMVDRVSARAVWKIASDENSPVFETGLYNLSLPQTSVTVHFGYDIENWLLIRM